MTRFGKGDRVAWSSHGNDVHGEVIDTITSETDAGGRHVVASKDEPQYLVRSDNNGSTAVHKPEALRRL